MASYNKVIIMGNLTRDPQLRFLPNQTPVVEITLATNHRYKAGDGSQREDVCFIDCNMFGRRAEIINQYLKKGNPLLVEGRLQLDRWEKDGQKHSKHRVFIENFQFVGGAREGSGGGGGGGGYNSGGGGGGGGGYNNAPQQQQQQQQGPGPQPDPYAGNNYNPPAAPPENYNNAPAPGGDDIPF